MIIKTNERAVSWIISKIIIVLFIVVGNIYFINIGGLFAMKPSEILSILIVVIYLLHKLRFHFKRHEKQIIIWLIIVTFSSIIGFFLFDYSIQDFLKGFFYPVRIIVLIFTIKFIHDSMQMHGITKKALVEYVLKCYLAVCLIGFFQRFFFPEAYSWYGIFWSLGSFETPVDPHINRLISTYYDPNYLAACLLIPFTISLHQWQSGESKKILYTATFGITIVLTVSRSGFLGMALICLLAFLRFNISKSTKWKNLLLVTCLLAGISFLLLRNASIIERIKNSASDPSTFARFDSWGYALSLVKQNPIFGIGYNMFDAISNVLYTAAERMEDGSDSSIIIILFSSGIVGIMYFFGAVFYNIYLSIKNKSFRQDRELVDVFLVALALCNFNNLLFYVLWLFPMLLLFGTGEEFRKENDKSSYQHLGLVQCYPTYCMPPKRSEMKRK